MSAIDASTSSRSLTGSSDAFSAMKSEDFIRVMFTELTNQDPLSPNESKDLLDQISTIRQIESDISTSQRLEDMVRQNELAASSGLIGKFVLGQSDSLVDVAGYVDSVSVTRDGVTLNLSGGFKVPLDRLEEVVDPALIGSAPTNKAPRLEADIPDQTAEPGQQFRFRFDIATFSDDAGTDSLTYSARLANGDPLPEWLTFNPTNREFVGTPPETASGPIAIRITASDALGAKASADFTLTISGTSTDDEDPTP